MNSRKVRIVQPYPFTHQFKVKKIDAGKTILALFFERFPFRAIDEWKRRIDTGLIQVNNQNKSVHHVLKEGELLSHHNPSVLEPSVPDEIQLLAETDDWIAFFKPAPMPMHSGGRYHKNTLLSIVEKQFGCYLFVTHRLDAVTSGIVLLAKNQKMADVISKAFRDGVVSKTYIAIVTGIPKEQKWIVEKRIKRKEGFVFECSDDSDAKFAQTEFLILDSFGKESLIECNPITGRTHQIRLHLLFSGHPICDDWVYKKENPSQSTLQNRAIKLCHNKLNIPDLGISLSCDIPDWWDLN